MKSRVQPSILLPLPCIIKCAPSHNHTLHAVLFIGVGSLALEKTTNFPPTNLHSKVALSESMYDFGLIAEKDSDHHVPALWTHRPRTRA